MNRVLVTKDPACRLHLIHPDHPESPGRLDAIAEMIDSLSETLSLTEEHGRDATEEELVAVHSSQLVARIRATAGRSYTWLDPDTSANEHSWAAALRAAGCTLHAAERVLDDRQLCAFAAVRPPGHHAERDSTKGFCLFNNVAIAAVHALRQRHCSRVMVVDWDVHHGNGTMHSFYDSRDVLYVSTHQFPHYPYTGSGDEIGTGEGRGFTVNIPFPSGAEDGDYFTAFERLVVPLSLQYRPDLIIISAGFDADARDPLSEMRLTPAIYGDMTCLLKNAARGSGAAVMAALEGGYNLDALAEGAGAMLVALSGGSDARNPETLPRSPWLDELIDSSRRALADYWDL